MGKLNVAIADDNEVMRDLLEEMEMCIRDREVKGSCVRHYVF